MTLFETGRRMLALRMHTPLYPPQTSRSPFNPRASDLSRQHPDEIQDQQTTSQKHVSQQRLLGALLRRVRMLLGELRYRTSFVPDGGGEPSRKPHASSDASPAVRHESSAARLHPAVSCPRCRRHTHPPSSRAGSQPCRGDCAHP